MPCPPLHATITYANPVSRGRSSAPWSSGTKVAVEDQVDGFEVGGNDYLIKPFAMAELVPCIRQRW